MSHQALWPSPRVYDYKTFAGLRVWFSDEVLKTVDRVERNAYLTYVETASAYAQKRDPAVDQTLCKVRISNSAGANKSYPHMQSQTMFEHIEIARRGAMVRGHGLSDVFIPVLVVGEQLHMECRVLWCLSFFSEFSRTKGTRHRWKDAGQDFHSSQWCRNLHTYADQEMLRYLKEVLSAERREMLDEAGRLWVSDHMAKVEAGMHPFDPPKPVRITPFVNKRGTVGPVSARSVRWQIGK